MNRFAHSGHLWLKECFGSGETRRVKWEREDSEPLYIYLAIFPETSPTRVLGFWSKIFTQMGNLGICDKNLNWGKTLAVLILFRSCDIKGCTKLIFLPKLIKNFERCLFFLKFLFLHMFEFSLSNSKLTPKIINLINSKKNHLLSLYFSKLYFWVLHFSLENCMYIYHFMAKSIR